MVVESDIVSRIEQWDLDRRNRLLADLNLDGASEADRAVDNDGNSIYIAKHRGVSEDDTVLS